MNPYIYHGTTLRRYNKIKIKGLKGDMQRHLTVDKHHMGYSFYSESATEVIGYALLTHYMDLIFKQREDDPSDMVVVLQINTSPYVNYLSKDPEYNPNMPQEMKDMFGDGQWWRCSKTIKPKDITLTATLQVIQQRPQVKELWYQAALASYIKEHHPALATRLSNGIKNGDIKVLHEIKELVRGKLIGN